MPSGADSVTGDDSARRLRSILTWSLGLTLVLVSMELFGRFSSHDSSSNRASWILGGFIVAEVAAVLALRRQRVTLAAGIFCWSLLVAAVACTTLASFITPPLVLMPLFAVALGLRFLRGKVLRTLMFVACSSVLWVAVDSTRFLPSRSMLLEVTFVASTTAIAVLIALLINDFSRRIHTALDTARDAIATREDFLSIASHELQTPLTVLKLNLQRLSQVITTAPMEETEEKLEIAKGQVSKLTRLVGNMLDLSRLQAGRLTFDVKPTRLETVVQQVVEELRPMAERAGTEIEVRVKQPTLGDWEPLRVEQVVSNFLSNAIKYGEGKPILLTIDRSGPDAELSIQDHGAGISEKDLARLFGKFERGTQTSAQTGVGLGLYISKQLLEAMGGGVTVTSQRHKGSTFTLRLPAKSEGTQG
jgi:signal transduction histidine kinase